MPRLQPTIIHRPRLIDKLNAGLALKLTLVCAPAGFGKSAALSDWLRNCDRPTTWLALDSGDNDPLRFWLHFIAALNQLQPNFGAPVIAGLKSSPAPPMPLFLSGLINEITETFPPFVLVLDDYHLIMEGAIHEALTFLIDYLPPQMHLAIATRADPPLSIGSLRGQGNLNELRTSDLRFTLDETRIFMTRSMALDLHQEEISLLDACTEGWIVGLQLAAISMRDRPDKQAFIAKLAGDNRYIADYLMEEVLQGQPGNIQDFLLKTAVLDHLTPALCQAVTGMDNSYQLLNELDRKNLFIMPMDEKRAWFRYHPLFADLLRVRLKQTNPEILHSLHLRASFWFETHNLPHEAVKHAFAMGDLERTANLIENLAIPLIAYGEVQSVINWLDRLPADYFTSHPWLRIARAWIALLGGQLAIAEAEVSQAEALYHDYAKDRRLAGHNATIRSGIAAFSSNQGLAQRYAQEALTHLPEEEYMARGLASLFLGLARRWAGDLAGALRAYAEAAGISRQSGDNFGAIYASCFMGYVLTLRGELQQAYYIFQETLENAALNTRRGGWKPPALGLHHSFLSGVLLEWDDLDAAINHARQGLDLSTQWGNANAILDGYFFYISILLAMGDNLNARAALQDAREIASGVPSWMRLDGALLAIQLHLAAGDGQLASEQIAEMGISKEDDLSFQNLQYYLALARVLSAAGKVDEALDLLHKALGIAKEAGALGRVVEIHIARALAWQRQDQKSTAIDALRQALEIAEPRGFVNTIIREGQPLGELLRAAAVRGYFPTYCGRLLSALARRSRLHQEKRVSRSPSLVEPLSERESQVLRLLVAGLTSREVAAELVIAVSTARTHIKHIYQKLNVHRRAEAIDRAKELNLV